jgi:hypothetical protein
MSAAAFFLKNFMISFYLSLVKFVFNGAYSIFSRSKHGLKTAKSAAEITSAPWNQGCHCASNFEFQSSCFLGY